MTLTEQEKIQRAEEIYYRRNGINYRTEKTQQSNYNKSHPIRNFILILMVIGLAFAYNNKELITSPEFKEHIKVFLNTKINIKDIFLVEPIKQNEENEVQNTNQQDQQVTEPIAQLTENIEQESKEINYEVIWPYKGEITSSFGMRESEDSRINGNHTGIDIAGNLGDKIISAISGNVIEVSEEGKLGKHVKIANDKITTIYAHCNSIYVQEGDEVSQGQEIGEIGSTGNSTGNHLHFETIKEEEHIDPITIIENNTVFETTESAEITINKEGEI